MQERRPLPSVSELVRVLEKETRAELTLVHKAARQACADDLARIKAGGEDETFEALLTHARELLRLAEMESAIAASAPVAFTAPGPPIHPEDDAVPFENLFQKRRPLLSTLRALLASRGVASEEEA